MKFALRHISSSSNQREESTDVYKVIGSWLDAMYSQMQLAAVTFFAGKLKSDEATD